MGNVETRALITFVGPLIHPTMRNLTIAGGPEISLISPKALEKEEHIKSLAIGQRAAVYLGTPRKIYLVATGESIYEWLQNYSTWWTLLPNTNNELELYEPHERDEEGKLNEGKALIEWASAWEL